MIKTFSVFATLVIGGMMSQSAFATNGGNLTGLSPASQAMGGTGVAFATTGTDAIYKNPALLSDTGSAAGKVVLDLSASYFNQNDTASNGVTSVSSLASGRFAPEIAATYKLNDQWAFGLGFLSFGGAVADFTGQTASNAGGTSPGSASVLSFDQLKTSLSLFRLAPAASYRVVDNPGQFGLTVGVSPFMTYGSLSINEDVSTPGTQSTRNQHGSVGVGVEGGVTAKILDNILVGLTFTSQSSVTYHSLLDLDQLGPNATALTGQPTSGLNDLQVSQPTEVAGGVAYKFSCGLVATADVRFIGWASAPGYSDLGWQNQVVVGGGAQYPIDRFVIRAGYNYGVSPIPAISGQSGQSTISVQGHTVYDVSQTKLNMIAFPAIAEHHISVGGGMKVVDNLNVDLGVVYSPQITVLQSGVFHGSSPDQATNFQAQVSQWSVALGVTYAF